jgi:hypothetical protein
LGSASCARRPAARCPLARLAPSARTRTQAQCTRTSLRNAQNTNTHKGCACTTTTNPTHPTAPPPTKPKELNGEFAEDIARYVDPEAPADEALLISIDALGADVRVRHGPEFNVERLGFGRRVETFDEARAAVRAALAAARARAA